MFPPFVLARRTPPVIRPESPRTITCLKDPACEVCPCVCETTEPVQLASCPLDRAHSNSTQDLGTERFLPSFGDRACSTSILHFEERAHSKSTQVLGTERVQLGHAAVSGPGPFARKNVVLTHAGQCARKKGFCQRKFFFRTWSGFKVVWCSKNHACQCFQHFAVLTVGMRFCNFCAFLGFVFCHCSGWNEVTAMWSYLEQCHAHQCCQHVACFWGAGVFRVQRACSGSSLGLWGCAETLSTESTVLVAKGMDACDRFSCSTSLCSMLYKETKTL